MDRDELAVRLIVNDIQYTDFNAFQDLGTDLIRYNAETGYDVALPIV